MCNFGAVVKGTEAVQEAAQVALTSINLVGGKMMCIGIFEQDGLRGVTKLDVGAWKKGLNES